MVLNLPWNLRVDDPHTDHKINIHFPNIVVLMLFIKVIRSYTNLPKYMCIF